MATAIKDDDSSLRKSEEREREERERVENFADFGTALLIIQFYTSSCSQDSIGGGMFSGFFSRARSNLNFGI